MIARVCPRLGLAALLATSASGCASDLDRAHVVAPDAPRPPRAQIYDRDRALVAGLATSLALGIVGLGTMLASGIYASPASGDPHPVPPAIVVSGAVMSTGFLATLPFALAIERHRARYPDLFPQQRGRTRVPSPNTPPPSLRAHNGDPGLSRQRTSAGPSLSPPALGPDPRPTLPHPALSLRPRPAL